MGSSLQNTAQATTCNVRPCEESPMLGFWHSTECHLPWQASQKEPCCPNSCCLHSHRAAEVLTSDQMLSSDTHIRTSHSDQASAATQTVSSVWIHHPSPDLCSDHPHLKRSLSSYLGLIILLHHIFSIIPDSTPTPWLVHLACHSMSPKEGRHYWGFLF